MTPIETIKSLAADANARLDKTMDKPSNYLTLNDCAAIRGDLKGIVEAAEALAKSDPVPEPEPQPEPQPEPTPQPEPPAPIEAPTVHKVQLDLTRVLTTYHYYWLFERYQRWINHVVLKSGIYVVEFGPTDIHRGGVAIDFLWPEYGYTLSGIVVARTKVSGKRAKFSINVDALPAEIADGYHQEGIVAFDANGNRVSQMQESVPPFHIVIDRNGRARDIDYTIVQSGTHDVFHKGNGVFYWAKIPKALIGPQPRPIAQRNGTAFGEALHKSKFTRINIVPWRSDDTYFPCVDENGIVTCATKHMYFVEDLERDDIWVHPALDGPRGVGTVSGPLWLQPGRRGGVYFMELNRIGHVHPDGRVQTLIGHVDPDGFGPYHGSAVKMQGRRLLRGNWDAVPVERRGFRGGWGAVWPRYTLETDETAAPINGEKPHKVGPQLLWTCRRHGRVLAADFDPRSHETPAKVREVITGFKEPWMLCEAVIDGVDAVVVTDRKAGKLLAYNIRTFVKLWEMPFVDPTGVAYRDGYLYVGSLARGGVYKVDVATKSETFFFKPTITAKSHYVFCEVSADGFGPPALIVSTFAEDYFGRPQIVTLDGKQWDWAGFSEVPQGAGGQTDNVVYATAAGAKYAALAYGGTDHGIAVTVQSQPGDVAFDPTRYIAGLREYRERGLHMIHGQGGYGFTKLPLPWGLSDAIDYYLTAHGHTRPT